MINSFENRSGSRRGWATFVCLLGLLFLSLVRVAAREDSDKSPWERSVVTLELNAKQYDYRQPWITRTKTAQKNGLVIGPREIITTAEDFSNHTLVRIQKNGRGKWYNATVQWVDYHANLVSLTAEDDTLWAGLKPAALARPVPSKEAMHVVRWRGGKFEVRKAEFNQFLIADSKTSWVQYLQFEASSEINGAGWAEPVVISDKVVGLATSHGGNTLAVTPSSFIADILEARKRGTFAGLGFFDFTWQPAENPSIAKFFKLTGEPRGVTVIKAPANSELREHDIILQVDGFAIDTQGDYEDPAYGPLMLENLATRSKWAGSEVKLQVWRDGQAREVKYRLPKVDFPAKFVPDRVPDQAPEYLIVGGLVFQPLSNDYLRSWGDDFKRRAPFRLNYFSNDEPTKERSGVVMLSLILPDPYNLGYQDQRYVPVSEINGRKISRLTDITEALKNPRDGFHVVDFLRSDNLRRLVLDASETETATRRVLQRYGIKQDHVFAAAGEKSPPDAKK